MALHTLLLFADLPTTDASAVVYQEVSENHYASSAFAHCRLDYCNALLAGVADVHLKRLQSVQNAAA